MLAATLSHLPHGPGRLERFAAFPSAHVAPRTVDVWVPPGYDEATERLGVLYLHDGQNLFDPALSYSGVPWNAHVHAQALVEEGLIEPLLIVGIWNTPRRIQEYMPERPLRETRDRRALKHFCDRFGDEPTSDAYLRFVVEELKPFIDGRYRTRPEPSHTAIAGSSMGGLLSLYAFCEYPDVFHRAACLSTSWTVAGPSLISYLQRRLPPPEGRRLYLDYGNEARVAGYESLQNQVNWLLKAAGYLHGPHWVTRVFPGAAHSEEAWGQRLDVPLRFLLGTPAAAADAMAA